jgi:hypothetical protein
MWASLLFPDYATGRPPCDCDALEGARHRNACAVMQHIRRVNRDWFEEHFHSSDPLVCFEPRAFVKTDEYF